MNLSYNVQTSLQTLALWCQPDQYRCTYIYVPHPAQHVRDVTYVGNVTYGEALRSRAHRVPKFLKFMY